MDQEYLLLVIAALVTVPGSMVAIQHATGVKEVVSLVDLVSGALGRKIATSVVALVPFKLIVEHVLALAYGIVQNAGILERPIAVATMAKWYVRLVMKNG